MNVAKKEWFLFLIFSLFLSACNKEIELMRGLSQRNSNEICALLSSHGIEFTKTPEKDGTWLVMVGDKHFPKSVDLIRENGLPREQFSGFGQLYEKKGMVSSPEEEKARYYHALSQELAQTISQTSSGVLSTRVHITPTKVDRFGEMQSESKASVIVVHHQDVVLVGNKQQYQNIVAHAIEGLRPENVKVTLFAEGKRSIKNNNSSSFAQN